MKDTDKVIHLNERQNRIMEIMRQQNAVSVATLSSLMKVSEVTIRKDLTMLEEQHMLYRVHGSAILVNRYINDRSVAEKEKLYADEKHAIGVYAARLIGPDDTIMVASGTTTLAMAREIGQNDRLTVITSAFSVASELSTRRSVDVIQLGGMVRRSSLSVLGPFAEQMLGSLSCSKLFMGVDGVDLDYGVTTTNHIEASLHKQMIASVQKVIVLADSSKFGRRGQDLRHERRRSDHYRRQGARFGDRAVAGVGRRRDGRTGRPPRIDCAIGKSVPVRNPYRDVAFVVSGRVKDGPSCGVTLACRRRRRRAPTR